MRPVEGWQNKCSDGLLDPRVRGNWAYGEIVPELDAVARRLRNRETRNQREQREQKLLHEICHDKEYVETTMEVSRSGRRRCYRRTNASKRLTSKLMMMQREQMRDIMVQVCTYDVH